MRFMYVDSSYIWTNLRRQNIQDIFVFDLKLCELFFIEKKSYHI